MQCNPNIVLNRLQRNVIAPGGCGPFGWDYLLAWVNWHIFYCTFVSHKDLCSGQLPNHLLFNLALSNLMPCHPPCSLLSDIPILIFGFTQNIGFPLASPGLCTSCTLSQESSSSLQPYLENTYTLWSSAQRSFLRRAQFLYFCFLAFLGTHTHAHTLV